MAYVYFVTVCLLFGSNFILMDRAVKVFGWSGVAAGRMLGGAAVLAVLLLLSKRKIQIDAIPLGKILAIALLSNAYPYALQPWLMEQGADHSFLAMFIPLTPLLTIAASIPMLGVRPTWQQIVGVLGGLALLTWMASDGTQHGLPWQLMPLVLSVPLSYAIGNTFLRRHLHQVPPVVLSTLILVLGGLMILPVAITHFVQNPPAATPEDWMTAIGCLVLLGALGTGACIVLFVRLVQDCGPLFAGMVTYVVPLLALSWGYFDGQYISATQLTAMVGILGMVALVQSGHSIHFQPKAKADLPSPPSAVGNLATASGLSDESP